jgi:predicted sulfurtransferase
LLKPTSVNPLILATYHFVPIREKAAVAIQKLRYTNIKRIAARIYLEIVPLTAMQHKS